MFKRFKFILFLVLIFIVISCKNSNTEITDTIKVYSWLSNQKELDKKIADEYEKETGQKVEFNYIGDMKTAEYYQKIDLMTLGNDFSIS